jgi:hypothetical protein
MRTMSIKAVIVALRAFRRRRRLGSVTVRQLIEDGRRR